MRPSRGPAARDRAARTARRLGPALVRFIVDPVFYFYMFWIPKYLVEVRGVPLQRVGAVVHLVLRLGISNVAGGWSSDRLILRGTRPCARVGVMAAAARLTTASGFAGRLKGLDAALAVMAPLMLCGTGSGSRITSR